MISYIRSRFDFLSAFCITAFFYLLVSIVATRYMYKKTKKFRTQILSHKNDNPLLLFMLVITICLSVTTIYTMPDSPPGPPKPDNMKKVTD
jgi:hypothetical protein